MPTLLCAGIYEPLDLNIRLVRRRKESICHTGQQLVYHRLRCIVRKIIGNRNSQGAELLHLLRMHPSICACGHHIKARDIWLILGSYLYREHTCHTAIIHVFSLQNCLQKGRRRI